MKQVIDSRRNQSYPKVDSSRNTEQTRKIDLVLPITRTIPPSLLSLHHYNAGDGCRAPGHPPPLLCVDVVAIQQDGEKDSEELSRVRDRRADQRIETRDAEVDEGLAERCRQREAKDRFLMEAYKQAAASAKGGRGGREGNMRSSVWGMNLVCFMTKKLGVFRCGLVSTCPSGALVARVQEALDPGENLSCSQSTRINIRLGMCHGKRGTSLFPARWRSSAYPRPISSVLSATCW